MSSNTMSTAQLAGIHRPHTFLCLAPVHSQSYPKAPTVPQSPELAAAAATASIGAVSPALLPADAFGTASPRSGSVSSVGGGGGQRFLKLSPALWGQPGEDFAIED